MTHRGTQHALRQRHDTQLWRLLGSWYSQGFIVVNRFKRLQSNNDSIYTRYSFSLLRCYITTLTLQAVAEWMCLDWLIGWLVS